MSLDHEAIYKAYPEVKSIRDDISSAFKDDGVTKVTLEQSKIDAARTDLNSEAAATQYRKERLGTRDSTSTTNYESIGNQLDQLYRDINAGKFGADAKTGEWFVGITSVKTANPKPS